ncbi:MAG TPA: Calx-beta domain-containing protein, partial [Pyrinomonadaceae bacterium]|nr:Calx-beta domain-containing protein [Pyrinomonadaceae bacterium]
MPTHNIVASSALATDQRRDGFPRIVNASVDIGAVEVSYSISATAGTPQSAAINTAFTTQLQVTVDESGNPASGIPVTFTAPTTGASGTFQGTGTNTATVNTNSSGVATAPVFDANSTAGGPYNVVASLDTGSPSVNLSLTNLKGNQTITFGALGDRRFGSLDFPLSATASSGLAVSFAASGQCTLNGSTVHITGAGSCSITASQAGDSNYNAAASVTQSFQIRKVSTFVNTHSVPNPSFVGQEVHLSATVQLDSLLPSSPTAVPTGTVQFQVDQHDLGGPVNCAPGSGNFCVADWGSTSALTAGDHGITANYSGDANFNPSTLQIPQTVAPVIINFSQSSYTVAERDGSVNISVERTGDTTQAASVDYSTEDNSTPSVAVPCSVALGRALERCDYTRAAGTLNFAPNETQKSFTVLVNDDSYVEGTETLSLRLSNPSSNAAVGQWATLRITDDQPESSGNPNDDAQTFVRQHYHDFLNREPDASGLQFWTNQMANCGASDTTVCHVNVSAAFFLSIESQQTGYLVERIYKVSFGDAQGTSSLGGTQHPLLVPVVRLSEFLRDTQEIGQGVAVGVGDWQGQLESNKQSFASEFVQRQRFTTAFPTSQTPAQFVDA